MTATHETKCSWPMSTALSKVVDPVGVQVRTVVSLEQETSLPSSQPDTPLTSCSCPASSLRSRKASPMGVSLILLFFSRSNLGA